jgi:hypothetical protein
MGKRAGGENLPGGGREPRRNPHRLGACATKEGQPANRRFRSGLSSK